MSDDPEKPLSAGEKLLDEDPAERAAQHRHRRFWRILALLLLGLPTLLLLIAAAAWVWRVPLANAVAPVLAKQLTGLPVHMTVLQLDTDLVEISDLQVEDGPYARSITLIPNLISNLIRGDPVLIDSLSITGLRGRVILDEAGAPMIAGLEPLFETQQESPDAGTITLPIRRIALSDSEFLAETPIGPQTVTGTLSLALAGAPALYPVTLDARLHSPDSRSSLLTTLTTDGRGLAVEGILDLSLSHWLPFLPELEEATGRATARIDLSSGPVDASFLSEYGLPGLLAAVSGTADLTWTGASLKPVHWGRILPKDASLSLVVEGGQVSLDLEEPLEIESNPIPQAMRNTLPDLLQPYTGGDPQIVISRTGDAPGALLRPDAGGGWRLAFGLDIGVALGPLAMTLTPEYLTLTERLDPDRLVLASGALDLVRGLDLPRDIALRLDIGEIELDPKTLISGSIPATDIPYTLETTIFGTILAPLWAERSALQATGILSLRDGLSGLDLTVDRGSQMRLDGLTGTGEVRLSPRLRLDVTEGKPMRVGLDLDDPAASLVVEGAFRLGALSLALPGLDPPFAVSLDSQPVSIRYQAMGTTLALGPVDATLPGLDAAIARLVLRADYGGRNGSLTLSAEGLTLANSPFLPGGLTANMALSEGRDGFYRMEGPVSLADGRITGNLALRLDPDGRQPTGMALETAPIRFGPGGLDSGDIIPAAFLPADTVLPRIQGEIAAKLDATMTNAGQQGLVTLALNGFGITHQDITLNNITSDIVFDLATPGATPGTQRLSGLLSVPGLPPMPARADFAIDVDRIVAIGSASLDLFGGEIALINTRLDPAIPSLEGTIRLRRLDMEQALQLLEIQGVRGTGKLSGLLPIRILKDVTVLTGGTVAADGGGVLQVDNETVNQALASDQQAVQLLTDTLKDFRYDGLSATLDMPPGADGRIGLSLSGHNPAVLNGHPFRINISFSSDFRNLFAILLNFLDSYSSFIGGVSLE